MNLEQFFHQIEPPIKWNDREGYWHCEGCGVLMDKSEKELKHWPLFCSLSKKKKLQKLREKVVRNNFNQFVQYCKERGEVNVPTFEELEKEDEPVSLDWYHKQLDNYHRLNMNLNIAEPSGVKAKESPPIQLRKITAQDLILKICKKKVIRTGDAIIDALPMSDMPFRDLNGNIIDIEEEE